MSALVVSEVVFALIMGSTIFGLFLRSKLPEQHLSGDSREVIRLATALIATMSAMVLALLFASTRTSYEQTSSYVSRLTTDVIELDELLKEYGPEARPLRVALRDEVGPLIDSIWLEDATKSGKPQTFRKAHSQSVLYLLRGLTPHDVVQSSLQAHALQVSTDMAQIRLILFVQPTDSRSKPFVTVLVLWLMFIFATFSMSSNPNATLITVLCICILSASGAIYLILELEEPFDGLMQISNASLRAALPPLPALPG